MNDTEEYKISTFAEKQIRQRLSDGYLNATDMCKSVGKLYGNWYQLDSTKEYLKALSCDIGYPISHLIQIKKGGQSNRQGTWIHPYAATNLAQWLSPKFAVFVSKLVCRYMAGDLTLIDEIKQNNDFLNEKLQKLEIENKEKEERLNEKETQINQLEKKQLRLRSFVSNLQLLEKNQVFYIATSKNYAQQNRFEYGGVKESKDLKGRLATYNTGRAEGDLFYYTKIIKCNNYKLIEERVGNVLQQFKDKLNSRKEMLHLRYNLLSEIVEFICDNYDKEMNFINARCQQFLQETINEDGIIPEPIDLKDHLEITVKQGGAVTKIKKIDITGWDDSKINELWIDVINKTAMEKNIQYDFSTQKNSLPVELTWSLITPYLQLYNGLTKTEWREKFKQWYNGEKPACLKVKGIKLS
jgi:hypothetical protein